MALTLKQAQSVKCPAAEIIQPVLSPNRIDYECRVIGTIRPPGQKPCDGCYATCRTWQIAKQREAADRTVRVQELGRRRAETHVLTDTGPRTRIDL